MNYAGPRRSVTVDELPDLERAGWRGEIKEDGVYAVAYVGAGGIVADLRYRSGARVGDDSGRDLLGLRTPWPAGTIVVGELQVQTPASRRWQDANGVRGLVLFDCLRWGDLAGQVRQLGAGTLGNGPLPARDLALAPFHERRAVLERLVGDLDGRAARTIHLVKQRRRGLAAWFRELVDAGAEGLVVKSPAGAVGKGLAKLKRYDTIDCTVTEVLPAEGIARVSMSCRPAFGVTLPKFPIAVGDVVEIAHCGFYESWAPRHARILRLRPDLGPAVIPAC